MTADPRDNVSEITEIDEGDIAPHLLAFVRAALWGTLSGGGVFLIFTVPIGIGMLTDGVIGGAIGVALLPLMVSGAGTLAGMVLVGLPLTVLLTQTGRECEKAYSRIGLLAGALLPAVFLLVTTGIGYEIISGGIFLGIFGAIAGGVTGRVWGNWRTSLHREAEGKRSPTEPQNPFHDMLH